MNWRDLKEGDVTISGESDFDVYTVGPVGGLAQTKIGEYFQSIKDAKAAILRTYAYRPLPRVFKVKGERAYPVQLLPAKVRNIITR